MARFVPSPSRRSLATAAILALLASATWVACWAQIPVDPDLGGNAATVLDDGRTEVGRVYRDTAGDTYTEH